MSEESRAFAERILAQTGWYKNATREERLVERLQLRPLTEFKREAVEMLRPGFMIPRGAVTVIVGQQGVGKSTLIGEQIAWVTKQGGHAIVLAEEDSIGKVVVPRLEGADADLSNVHVVTAVRDDDLDGVLLPRDVGALKRLAQELPVQLLVIDPWSNHLDGIDVDRGAVRQALMPLAHLADELNLAVLLAAHPNKVVNDDPLVNIAHASAVSQVSRAAFYLVPDVELGSASPTENPHRLLLHIKANWTPFGKSKRYTIERDILLPAADGAPEMKTAKIILTGESDMTWLDYRGKAKAQSSSGDRPLTKTAETKFWLRDLLGEAGDMEGRLVIEMGEAKGYSERTIRRAAHDLGVEKYRPDGADATAPVIWRFGPRVGQEISSAEPAEPHSCVNDVTPHEQSVRPVRPVQPTDSYGRADGRTEEPAPFMKMLPDAQAETARDGSAGGNDE